MRTSIKKKHKPAPTYSSSDNSPIIPVKLRKKDRRYKNSDRKQIIQSLDSICEMCTDFLKTETSKIDERQDTKSYELRSSCISLVTSLSDDSKKGQIRQILYFTFSHLQKSQKKYFFPLISFACFNVLIVNFLCQRNLTQYLFIFMYIKDPAYVSYFIPASQE